MTNLHVRIPVELKKLLDERAANDRRTLAVTVEELLAEALKRTTKRKPG